MTKLITASQFADPDAAYLALVDIYEHAARASTGGAEPEEPR